MLNSPEDNAKLHRRFQSTLCGERLDGRSSMNEATTKFSTQVPVKRLRRSEKILDKLGLTPADAVNMLLAQIEIRRGLPFEVRTQWNPLLSADEQATAWTEAFGAY